MRLFLSLVFINSAIISVAQTDIICLKLSDSTENIFYIGVDNPIKIVSKNDMGNYNIAIVGGTGWLTKTGRNEYVVRVAGVTDTFIIAINQYNRNVFKKQFKIRTIPAPIATLNGMYDTTLSKSRILVNPFLSVTFPGCSFQLHMPVVSFRSVFIDGNDSNFVSASGNRLTE